jgi:hypothetical protein
MIVFTTLRGEREVSKFKKLLPSPMFLRRENKIEGLIGFSDCSEQLIHYDSARFPSDEREGPSRCHCRD